MSLKSRLAHARYAIHPANASRFSAWLGRKWFKTAGGDPALRLLVHDPAFYKPAAGHARRCELDWTGAIRQKDQRRFVLSHARETSAIGQDVATRGAQRSVPRSSSSAHIKIDRAARAVEPYGR